MNRASIGCCLLIGACAVSWAARASRRKPAPASSYQISKQSYEAQPAIKALEARLNEARKDILERMGGLNRKLKDIEALQKSYDSADDLKKLSREREALLDETRKEFIEFGRQMDKMENLRESYDLMTANSAHENALKGVLIADALTQFQLSQAFIKFTNEDVADFRGRVQQTFRAEETAFQSAESVRFQRRVWLFAGVLLAALALPATGIILWRRRIYLAPLGPEPRPGSIIKGNYRVEKETARDETGAVYEALDMTLKRKAAIRLLKADRASGVRLLKEARLIATLKHPNIREVYSVFEEGGRVHLVFEHIDGEALSRLLEGGRRLAPLQALRILRQVAAALKYAHGVNVLHGGLSLACILITREGAVKVTDFKNPRGGAFDQGADLLAAGRLLRVMVFGPAPAQSAMPTISVAVDALMRKALCEDPQARFRSAQELLAAIDGAAH